MTATEKAEPTPIKLALTVPEACQRVGIGRSRLFEEMRTGRLRRKKVGSRTIILAADLDAWINGLDG